MEIQTSHDEHFITEQAKAWQNLVHSTSSQPFFSLPAYQTAWWHHFGRGQLEILAGFEAGQLIGLAPFFSETTGENTIWRLIGAVDVSDYLDILTQDTNRQRFFIQMADYLTQHVPANQTIKLESIKGSSATVSEFVPSMQQAGWQVEQTEQDVCPVVTLPSSWTSYLDTLPHHTKKNFTKLLANIGADDDISYSLITDSDQLSAAIPTFIKLHKASGHDKNNFWSPAMEQFFLEMTTTLAAEQLVKLYFLHVNGQPAASLLIFDYQNEFLVYNSGFDSFRYGYLGVGNALFLHTIRQAIELGRTRYDFMRGSEKYKFLFGAVPEPIYDFTFTR